MRLRAFFCLVVVLCTPAFGQEPVPLLTAPEAVALVSARAGSLTGAVTAPATVHGHPAFTLSGKATNGPVDAVIDAQAARVTTISINGKESYTWPGIVAVGHRGTLKFAPENTIAAFNKAIELGADLLEMDIRETKDGQLVIMHDANIVRTTSQRGNVAELTLAEIKEADAGVKYNPANAGEKVPTFAEVLKAIEGRALPDIDFKAGDPQKVIDAVRNAGLIGKVTLFCGDWPKMHATLAIEKGFMVRPTAPKGLEGLESVLKEFDPPIVNIDWKFFSEKLVREIHLAGKLAFVNMMGNEDTEAGMVRAIEAGADYIQSDRLDILVPLLRARGLHR